IGAFLASDMDAMFSRGVFDSDRAGVITGGAELAEAWRGALAQNCIRGFPLDGSEVERAMLAGLLRVFSALGQGSVRRALEQLSIFNCPLNCSCRDQVTTSLLNNGQLTMLFP